MGFPKLRKEFQQSVHWCFMGLGTQLFANPTVLKKKTNPTFQQMRVKHSAFCYQLPLVGQDFAAFLLFRKCGALSVA